MIVIVLIVLMSFGVSRQAIKYPNEDWSWQSVKKIFLEPYFMVGRIFNLIKQFLIQIDLW